MAGAATAVDQEAAVVPVEADPHLHVKAPPHVPAIPESSQNAINLSAHKLAAHTGPLVDLSIKHLTGRSRWEKSPMRRCCVPV